MWEFDPETQKLALIFESPGADVLEGPDNMVAPKTKDIFICEDASDPQYIRGVTRSGEIFDFARSITNGSEFCGACFSPDGETLFVSQQGGNVDSGEVGHLRHHRTLRPQSGRPPATRSEELRDETGKRSPPPL